MTITISNKKWKKLNEQIKKIIAEISINKQLVDFSSGSSVLIVMEGNTASIAIKKNSRTFFVEFNFKNDIWEIKEKVILEDGKNDN